MKPKEQQPIKLNWTYNRLKHKRQMKSKDYAELEKVFADLYKQNFEEGIYFVFDGVSNKRHFIKDVYYEYIPTLISRANSQKHLGSYGQNRLFLYENAINFLTEWVEEKAIHYKIELTEGNIKNLPPQQKTNENKTLQYKAKHYVLAYLIECNAKGESFPHGQKKELEKIGNKKMGIGKGNRFYKVFNEIVQKDINAENNLIEIGGENWRTIVKDLSDEPETIETYLQTKRL